jgi:hypothetical protein
MSDWGESDVSVTAPPPRDVPVRGASEDELDRPAGAYLASIRWDGTLDPDALAAAAFLARL